MSKMGELDAFCDEVDALVEKDYGYSDGGDLCFNLIESGVVKVDDGVQQAAATVAQHIGQA